MHELCKFSDSVQISKSIFESKQDEKFHFVKLAKLRKRFCLALFSIEQVGLECIKIQKEHTYVRMISKNGISNNEKSARNDMYMAEAASTASKLLQSTKYNRHKKVAKLFSEMVWTYEALAHFYNEFAHHSPFKKAISRRFDEFNDIRKLCISNNTRLLTCIASELFNNRHAKSKGFAIEDLVEEGTFGLMKAVDQFDTSLNYRFSTFAQSWVEQKIIRLLEEDRLVKVPVHLTRCMNYISKEDNIKRPDQEIAKACKTTASTVKNAKSCVRSRLDKPLSSLNRETKNDDTETFTYLAVDHSKSSADEVADNDVGTYITDLARRILTHREFEIIRRRYLADTTETLSSITREWHVSRERIRQIESKALDKLRKFGRMVGYDNEEISDD